MALGMLRETWVTELRVFDKWRAGKHHLTLEILTNDLHFTKVLYNGHDTSIISLTTRYTTSISVNSRHRSQNNILSVTEERFFWNA